MALVADTALNHHSLTLSRLVVIKVHNVFPKVTFPPWLHPVKNMASHREQIVEKTLKSTIIYAGPTNLCQHFTTDLARGIMTNERKQSARSKARSFKYSKTTSSFFVFDLSPTSTHERGRFHAF